VYRRDAIDWQHTGTPHQLDLWRITRRAMGGAELDLALYRRVSSMPAITRDLSIAVADDEDEETLGDRVRDALGADARCVEEVRVIAATAYRQLPAPAIGRLGARPGQQNLLLRIVLRDLDTTLTREAANTLRDRIYRALHQGTEHQYAERPGAVPAP
jgi:phenylalanyl-tRNA synthetase alpha chain